MQSEPNESSSALTNTFAEQPIQPSQHGFHSPDIHPALRADSHNERSGEVPGAAPTVVGDGDVPGSLPRLNGVADRTRRSQSSNVVSEYENALTPRSPKSPAQGPGFKVIRSKSNRRDGPRLDEFPNEVLTHILSHLPANSLSAVSLVSRRFYNLVTTPHAWRIAFSRFFPGQDVVDNDYISRSNRRGSDQDARDSLRAEQRFFTRLTALASWRSEYILRTRLLRSLARGKPQQLARGHGVPFRPHNVVNNGSASVTYNSQLLATVNHIHAVFNSGRKSPRFMHGTDETGHASISDPTIGKVDSWGWSDPQPLRQFADLFPGDQPYGLGDGSLIGAPNVMDVSQPFGMIYGEGFPGGLAYFRSSDEMRGRFLAHSAHHPDYPPEIPRVPSTSESISAVWIAKNAAVPSLTDGLVGIITGSSCGIVTTYALGSDRLDGQRLAKGEITARWVLSPGVPIIALNVDDSYSEKRKAAKRVWAAALNALGELFYLTDSIHRAPTEKAIKLDEEGLTKLAWQTGRNVAWKLVERRVAREDHYQTADFDGSYSPRSSPESSHLSKQELLAESREIEIFLKFRPAHFQKICEGWDMRRRLEVDFAGDDGHGAGECAVVIKCGTPESGPAQIRRFTRVMAEGTSLDHYAVPRTPPITPKRTPAASIFGGGKPVSPTDTRSPVQPATPASPVHSNAKPSLVEEWRKTNLVWEGSQAIELTTSAIDTSTYALLTASEDPILTMNGGSAASSAFATPEYKDTRSVTDIPGYRGRFIAVGTKTGTIYVWNMRGPQSSNSAIINNLQPVRTIYTDSPQISCLALSALYLVHGGNDGLVQAWDTLASTTQPIRTLNSRFSSRARRRLVQAEASAQGVGINLFAAGAIALDPEPTSLRGMVSLGTHLRYWAYSSTAADEVSSKKRRLRRSSERGTNSATDRYTHTGRGALMDYIVNEQQELKREKERREKEQDHLHGRFGVGLAGLSDEEALLYAELISQEAFEQEEERKLAEASSSPVREVPSSFASGLSSPTMSPEPSISGRNISPRLKTDDELENDIEEAIRLSLLETVDQSYTSPPSGSAYDVQFVVKQKKSRRSPSTSPSTSQASRSRRGLKGKDKEGEIALDDLDYALQLSLVEEQSRTETGDLETDFPALDEARWKGKGRVI